MRQSFGRGQRQLDGVAAALPRAPRASVVDQYSPQQLTGHRKEMRAILPLDGFRRKQLHVQLADQFGGLNCVIRALLAQVVSGQSAEMLIRSGHQRVAGGLVTGAPLCEKGGPLRAELGQSTAPSDRLRSRDFADSR